MKAPAVLHVIPDLAIGGAEQMLAALVTAQRNESISQIVVNMGCGGELARPIHAAGVPIHNLGMKTPLDLPIALLRLTALIRRVQPIALQSWLYYADLISLWAVELSGRRTMTRLYWGVRCSDMDQRRYSSLLRRAISACANRSRKPDAVVANSFIGRTVHEKLGYKPRAFPVIPNGIDLRRFRSDPAARRRMRAELSVPEHNPLIIHVARADPMKDHDSLVAVARALPNVVFVAAGAGTELLSSPPNMTTLGSRDDMPNLYAAADLAFSTSAFGEGFSNVIAEAMASELPVVATRVGDAPYIIGNTGQIVEARDHVAMTEAIRHLLSEPELQRRERGVAARRRIETHFSLGRAVAAFDALHLHAILPEHVTPANQDM